MNNGRRSRDRTSVISNRIHDALRSVTSSTQYVPGIDGPVRVRAGDRQGKENISRYLIRTPFSVDNIQYSFREGSVIYKTRRVRGAEPARISDRRELLRHYGWCFSVQRWKRRKQPERLVPSPDRQ